MKNHKISLILLICLVISFPALFSGCGGDDEQVPLAHEAAAADPQKDNGQTGLSDRVKTADVQKASGESLFETTGTFEGWDMITVSSEVDGVIEKIHVNIGDRVAQGALLVQLVDRDFELNAARGEAARASAQANLDNALLEFERKEMLLRDETIPKSVYDMYKTKLDQAKAGLQLAETELALARERLAKTKILAPVAGSIQNKFRSQGEYINMMTGYDLVQLVVNDPLKLIFNLPERFALRVKAGDEVQARVPALGEARIAGKIYAVSPAVDPGTRTIRIEARVDNKDGRLKSGLFAVVLYSPGYSEALFLVPREAVKTENGRSSVRVLARGEAQEMVVTIVEPIHDQYKVTGELKEGMKVILR
jgi:membrane fusion protein (multidrug efflux system)